MAVMSIPFEEPWPEEKESENVLQKQGLFKRLFKRQPKEQSSGQPTLRISNSFPSAGPDQKQTSGLDMEKVEAEYGWDPVHRVYGPADSDPLSSCRVLGQGASGTVEEVHVKGQADVRFVRKRVQIPFVAAKRIIKAIQEEEAVLRSLKHPHIIKVIGSYEQKMSNNRRFFFLLMAPVGEGDLETFLELAQDPVHAPHNWRNLLKKWVLCLSSALAYIHSQGIRHEDIKPSNIIYRRGEVYFTDFGSASRFELGQTTTSTESLAHATPRYRAPELFVQDNDDTFPKHGRPADIFALGCVFLEMLTVLCSRKIFDLHQYLQGSRPRLLYSETIGGAHTWFGGRLAKHCIFPMIDAVPKARPNACTVFLIIENHYAAHDFIVDSCVHGHGLMVRDIIGANEAVKTMVE